MSWRYWNTGDWIFFGTIALLWFLAMLLMPLYGIAAARTDAECLRRGYPQSYIDYRRTSYCVRRVNQTDQVAPLDSLRANPPRPQGHMVAPGAVRWVAL